MTRLQELDLSFTEVADEGVKELAGLKELQQLDLRDTNVTDAGVRNLRKSLPKVRIRD